MKSALFFGIFDPDYSRNRVLMKGFRENGWSVDMCRVNPRETKGLAKYSALWRAGKEASARQSYDLVIVAFPGQTVAWMARILFGSMIVFDAFLSMYDSNVNDRKIYSRCSPKAWRDFFFDWLSSAVSAKTLLDTNEHIAYYSRTFMIPRRKFLRALIGADDSIFSPRASPTADHPGRFIVEFHGMFIPLQGVDRIVAAARSLASHPEIVFRLYGNGQTFARAKELAAGLSNVEFLGQIPMTSLPEKIAEADLCLGIFGDTDKARRVIPNKVYECAAMGKAIITADTPALREVFSDGKDVLSSKTADSGDLAENVLAAASDPDLRRRVGRAARETFERTTSPKKIVERLIHDLYI